MLVCGSLSGAWLLATVVQCQDKVVVMKVIVVTIARPISSPALSVPGSIWLWERGKGADMGGLISLRVGSLGGLSRYTGLPA